MEIFMLLITTMAAFKCSNFSTYMYTPVVMYVYVTIFSSVLHYLYKEPGKNIHERRNQAHKTVVDWKNDRIEVF